MQVAVATTTIDTIEDLVRVLDENPAWLEAVRARLLTRELLELPQKLAAFAEATERQFEAINRQFEAIDRRFEANDRRFVQLLTDIAPIKAAHARNAAVREADLIAEDSGLRFVRVLNDSQVAELARLGPAAGIAKNELRSFRRADLLVEGRDAAGETCYLATEISFTVNGRDTTRAIRNARLLTRFTGRPAYAVVAGLRHDQRIEKRLEAGEVSWYQLDPQTLEVE
jgi:hypothetical protein